MSNFSFWLSSLCWMFFPLSFSLLFLDKIIFTFPLCCDRAKVYYFEIFSVRSCALYPSICAKFSWEFFLILSIRAFSPCKCTHNIKFLISSRFNAVCSVSFAHFQMKIQRQGDDEGYERNESFPSRNVIVWVLQWEQSQCISGKTCQPSYHHLHPVFSLGFVSLLAAAPFSHTWIRYLCIACVVFIHLFSSNFPHKMVWRRKNWMKKERWNKAKNHIK